MKTSFMFLATTAVLTFCYEMEIELNPPELTVMDYNLTMISCVVRFNSSEPEPSIFFRYNEIWITPGFNYTKQTSDGLSPPNKVPCPSLYADKRSCTTFLMYVVGTPKINGSSLMCTALVNGVRMATSTTVTIIVMMEEEGEQTSLTPSPSPTQLPSPSPTLVGEVSTQTPGCDCNSTDTGSSTGTDSVAVSVPVVAVVAVVGAVVLLLVGAVMILLLVLVKKSRTGKGENTENH